MNNNQRQIYTQAAMVSILRSNILRILYTDTGKVPNEQEKAMTAEATCNNELYVNDQGFLTTRG